MANNIKPIKTKHVLIIFLVTLIPILIGVYLIIPSIMNKGVPFFIAYLICFQTIPFVFIFALALVLYKKEGNPMDWKSFKTRMRLKFNGKIFLAALILLVLGIASYLVLQAITALLSQTQLFSPPSWLGPDIHPLKVSNAGEFMGMALKGAWWAPLVYLIGWFFNIFGEELLFRGYLMPRMELSYGSKACLVNSACWWTWHMFWRWQLIALFPFIFFLPFIAQKTKSTVPGLVAHGTMNFIAIIKIVLTVI